MPQTTVRCEHRSETGRQCQRRTAHASLLCTVHDPAYWAHAPIALLPSIPREVKYAAEVCQLSTCGAKLQEPRHHNARYCNRDHQRKAFLLKQDAKYPGRISRKVRRVRRTRPRATTIAPKSLSREEIQMGQLLATPDVDRPVTRAECKDMPRPCPFVSCKHHLYLDVNPETGSIKLNFPDLEVWEMKETCSLDVADRGGITLEEVGEILNLTRERIRQVEVRGLLKLKMGEPNGEMNPLE